ncbi:hypothetical protein [Actinoplanes sp. NPDC049681]|uniref:hypothetical protein n=1 Tax=Actinoplanes sp. NPDC049681 TaxID=3363905 RepID=UPI0037A9C066
MLLRPTTAALALLTAAAALSGCDPDPAPDARQASPGPQSTAATSLPASASVCDDPDVDFGPVRRREVLTAVAREITITAPKGGRLDPEFEPVRRYTAEVVAPGNVPRQLVYDAFLHKISPDSVYPELGSDPGTGGKITRVDGPGRIVVYRGVYAREATFRYRCGAVDVTGTVSSWTTPVTGVLDCDEKPAGKHEMASEAARRSCAR